MLRALYSFFLMAGTIKKDKAKKLYLKNWKSYLITWKMEERC